MKKKDLEDMERKIRTFRTANKVRGAIHPVLVTTYGIVENAYSNIFQNVITLEDLIK